MEIENLKLQKQIDELISQNSILQKGLDLSKTTWTFYNKSYQYTYNLKNDANDFSDYPFQYMFISDAASLDDNQNGFSFSLESSGRIRFHAPDKNEHYISTKLFMTTMLRNNPTSRIDLTCGVTTTLLADTNDRSCFGVWSIGPRYVEAMVGIENPQIAIKDGQEIWLDFTGWGYDCVGEQMWVVGGLAEPDSEFTALRTKLDIQVLK